MKKMGNKLIMMILAVTSIVFASCENSLNGIKGEGPIVTSVTEIGDIEGIQLDIIGDVYITKGQTEGIRIEAQQNILENINMVVNNKVLNLKFEKNVDKSDEIKIYINMEYLKEASIGGSGNIWSDDDLNTDETLYVNISGSGNVDIKSDAPEVEIAISGSGDVRLRTNTQKLSNSISGSGNIMLGGACTGTTHIAISGSGNVSAYDFETNSCTTSTSGSGNTKIRVSDALDVQISGSGNVYYKGYPGINVQISGSGSLINAN